MKDKLYKNPKLFEDGEYLGKIEMIGTTRTDEIYLYISNRKPNLWIFSLFNGYRQIGIFKATQFDSMRSTELNSFNEGDLVIVTKKDGKIIKIEKDNPI
jgi:6-phosphogluconolactonase (cycloisomerase 2 family)